MNSSRNILRRTQARAFPAPETVPGILFQFHPCRTIPSTRIAVLRAMFPIAPQSRPRHNRKQSEYCTHRAKETTEKSFLHGHPGQNQYQQHNPRNIVAQLEVQSGHHRKYIPGTPSGDAPINPNRTQQYNQSKKQIGQIAEFFGHALWQAKFLFPTRFSNFFPQKIHAVSQCSKCTGIAAEESTRDHGKGTQGKQGFQETVPCQRLSGTDLRKYILYARKCTGKQGGCREEKHNLYACTDISRLFSMVLFLLCRCQNLFFCSFYYCDTACSNAFSTASLIPLELNVAPETTSTSHVCASIIDFRISSAIAK